MARTAPWRRARGTGEADEAGGNAEVGADGSAATGPDPVATTAGATPDGAPDDAADDAAGDAADDAAGEGPAARLGELTPALLARAAHPRQAGVTAVGMAVAAALSGRAGREVLLVLVTVLVGQVVLGWFNDLVDHRRDARHQLPGKPLLGGRLDAATLWFSLAVAVFAVVPLAFANGVHAGTAYLVSLAVGLAGTWTLNLRRGFFSWAPWAVSFALYPAFLSYGGWGGQYDGRPPTVAMTVLAALLGVGAHLLTSLWGLVPDHEDGWTYLPVRLGLRLGASRLLWVATTYVGVVLLAMAVVGATRGLEQPPVS